MTAETNSFLLQARGTLAAPPVLSAVTATGRLDGVLFGLTLRQTYRNRSDEVLEVVYTFPLPARAALLGFASELNGERKEGRIVAAAVAERRYEAALDQGDAPVMLESLPGGLYSANIGNLAPGDEIVLEVRFAELLRFDGNRLRVAIPTTIAPRYGDPARAGLQPQQVPQASLEVDYPLALSVNLGAAFRGAALECPTHRSSCEPTGDGMRFELAPGARLDRDVVLVVTLREPRPGLLVQAADPHSASAPWVLMAALQPAPKPGRDAIALKILVDCSSSMAGDSIGSAKDALRGIVAGLEERDWVGLSRFGTTVQHLLEPAPCTPRKIAQAAHLVDSLQADMGGTETHGALRSVFLQPTEGFRGKPDVLLITDGQIWQSQDLLASARVGGHRIFIVAVGCAAAEAGLRDLADATCGFCEFVTPGENLKAAARRMIDRMHHNSWHQPAVEWGGTPLWQTALPASVVGGDTVIAFAGMAAQPGNAMVRLIAPGDNGSPTEIARSEAGAPDAGDDLARMAAWMALSADSLTVQEKTALAIDHQLMTPWTKCVLVHTRAEADKTMDAARLHQVKPMLAAGWGGTSSVRSVYSARDSAGGSQGFGGYAEAFGGIFGEIFGGTRHVATACRGFRGGAASDDPMDISASAATPPPPVSQDPTPPPLLAVAEHVAASQSSADSMDALAESCKAIVIDKAVRDAIDQGRKLTGLGEGEAWLVLAAWINEQWPDPYRDARAQALKVALTRLDQTKLETLLALFDRLLEHLVPATDLTSRSRRLARAARATPV